MSERPISPGQPGLADPNIKDLMEKVDLLFSLCVYVCACVSPGGGLGR